MGKGIWSCGRLVECLLEYGFEEIDEESMVLVVISMEGWAF